MKTKKKLQLSSYFLTFLMSLSLLVAFSLAFIYFHSMYSPEKYAKLIVNQERNIIYKTDAEKIPLTYEEWRVSSKLFYYTQLDGYSKFSVMWSKIIGLFIFFLILNLFNKFLKNTSNLNLFFEKNIEIINKILKLLVALFLFNFLVAGYDNSLSMVFEETQIPHHITSAKISLDFYSYYPLAFIFLFTLKEVFKRGYELKQENDLTI